MAEDIFITAAARTALGSFQGALRDLTAPEIGGTAIAESWTSKVWIKP